MGTNGYRLPLAVGVAIAAAGAATVALRPRRGLMEPAPVDAEGYFSQEEIDRARRYQRPRRALGFAGLALEGGAHGPLRPAEARLELQHVLLGNELHHAAELGPERLGHERDRGLAE